MVHRVGAGDPPQVNVNPIPNGPQNANPGFLGTLRQDLNDIQQVLNQLNLNDPFPLAVARWHQAFEQELGRARRHITPEEITARFVTAMENALSDPLHPEDPFPRRYFVGDPGPLLQALIPKLTRPGAPLFSQRVNAAAVAARRAALREQVRQINEERAQRLQEEEDNREGIQALRERLQRMREANRADIDRVQQQFNEGIAPIRQGIEELREAIPRQREEIRVNAERMQGEIAEIREGIGGLRRDNQDVQQGIHEVRQEQAQLDQTMNSLDNQIQDLKDKWADQLMTSIVLGVVAAAVTWGASTCISGAFATIEVTKNSFMVGLSVGAGSFASHQNERVPKQQGKY